MMPAPRKEQKAGGCNQQKPAKEAERILEECPRRRNNESTADEQTEGQFRIVFRGRASEPEQEPARMGGRYKTCAAESREEEPSSDHYCESHNFNHRRAAPSASARLQRPDCPCAIRDASGLPRRPDAGQNEPERHGEVGDWKQNTRPVDLEDENQPHHGAVRGSADHSKPANPGRAE